MTTFHSSYPERSLALVPPAESGFAPATMVHVVGARPNFVKMAPVIAALDECPELRSLVVHTGQHYDGKMSDDILADLEFRAPDRFLGVGSGNHGEQTAKVLTAMEQVLIETSPVAVVVAGDVNSTLAAALAAAKLGIPVAHLESGLRSEDWSMPEEINRVLTDRLSDLLFTHSPEAEENLSREGIEGGRVHYVGNTMIDSLRRCERRARDRARLDAVRRQRPRVRAGHAAPAVQRGRPGPARGHHRRADRARRHVARSCSRSTRARGPGSRRRGRS